VPEVIKRRQKQPYRAPIREVFFSGQDRSYVDEMLSEQCLRQYGYFNPQKVNLLISKLKKGDLAISSEVQNMALAGILSTQLLHYQFIEKYPPEKVTLVSPDKVIRKSSSQEK
jgi:asparagine synthase (glutamine-hydrolysing)